MDISQKNVTDKIISRMKVAVGAKDDLDLGRKLGSKSRGYVSNWRKNNHVPAKAIERASQVSGMSFEKIKYGETQTVREGKATYELNQNLLEMIYQCFDEYEDNNGKLPRADRARITMLIYREHADQATTLDEIRRAIRTLINYNK